LSGANAKPTGERAAEWVFRVIIDAPSQATQAEESALRIRALIPNDSRNVTKTNRVEGVGVSGLIDINVKPAGKP